MACRSYLASVLWWQGLADQARSMSESALRLARELGHAHSLAFALYIASRLRFQLRDYAGVIACTDECIALSAEYGFPIWQTLGTMMRGRALVATGETEQGIAMVDKALGLYRARGAGLSLPYYLGLHAGALALSGRADEGMAAIEQALADAERFGAHTEQAELLRIRAELWRRGGDEDRAEQGLRDALALAHRQGARAFALRAALSLAELLHERGETVQAREVLGPIFASFDEGHATPDLEAARALLAAD